MTSAPTQQLPASAEQAQRELEFWQARLTLAQVKFMVARRQMEQAQNDLDLVRAVARGDFEEDAPVGTNNGYVQSIHREHAVGSHGPWGWTV